jgi:hypothetical protein
MNGSDVAPRNIISQFEDRSQKVNGFPPKKDGPIPTIGKMDGKVTQRRLEMDASIDQMTDTMERELRLNGSIGAGQRNAIPANLPQNSAQVARNDEKENINKVIFSPMFLQYIPQFKTGTNSFEADEAKAVKAPPPSIPTNLFSPTEKKQMTFPEPSKSQPPPQPAPPKEPAPKVN